MTFALRAAIAAAILLPAGPALACQYEFAPEPVGGPTASFLASKMAPAASFIDLAVAEGETAIRAPDGTTSQWSRGIAFRVIDRWKGASADRFLLFGTLAPQNEPGAAWSLTHWVDDEGRVYPHESVREATVGRPNRMTSCDPPGLSAKRGQTYVILREADGRLLGAVEYHQGMTPRAGTSIAEVNLWPDHGWARQLNHHRAPQAGRPVAAGSAEASPNHASVRFSRPIPASVVTELLRRAGAVPFGVALVRGGVTSDYRLDTSLAWLGIVQDATAWANAAATTPALLKSQAVMLVDAYALRDVTNDGAKQQHARSVLALAEAAAEQGPALIAAVDVTASSAVQQALRRLPEVAAVVPAAMVRKRVATAALPRLPASGALAQVSPIDLHRRLTSIAGKDIDPASLNGRWRLVAGDSTQLGKKVFVLELRNGVATAAMPCARTNGRYRFSGQILELDMPKPAFDQCPKHQDYWYPEYFLDIKTPVTARLSGNRLEIVAESGSFHFVRESAN